ncbi:MAG: putative ABC transporter permease [Clostridia bacterium]
MLVCQYFVWFMLYSVIGWVHESIYCSIQQRQLVNRGFLNGPLCPIYGAGAILVLFLFRSLQNPALIFIAGALATGVLEYVTSWLMEKLFHARWWDYEDWRFNLHGRVCLAGVAAFGAMSRDLDQGHSPAGCCLDFTDGAGRCRGNGGCALASFAGGYGDHHHAAVEAE